MPASNAVYRKPGSKRRERHAKQNLNQAWGVMSYRRKVIPKDKVRTYALNHVNFAFCAYRRRDREHRQHVECEPDHNRTKRGNRHDCHGDNCYQNKHGEDRKRESPVPLYDRVGVIILVIH